jgi:uncharacterized cupin superfamily protein
VIAGTPTLRTPEGERVLAAWDSAYFVRGPAGAHGLRNDTDEAARVVFFSTVSDPEVAVYPDEDKVGVIAGFTNPNVEAFRGWVDVE